MREFILLFAIIAIAYANNFTSCGECKKIVETHKNEITEIIQKSCDQVKTPDECESYVKIATTDVCESMKLCPPKKKYWLGFLG
jgi:hypothetical protein